MESEHLRQLDRCRVPHFTGQFTFRHSSHSYYWIVKGPVPVNVAWQMYYDPCGRQIRVAGHCLAPEPVDPWITWRMPDGTKLADLDAEKELDSSPILNEDDLRDFKRGYTFTDDPEKTARAKAYVELYHIDSEVGLRVFVDYLRWNGLL